MKKRFIISVLGLTMALSLSMASLAFAANANGDGTAPITNPVVYPVGDQIPKGDLKTTLVDNNDANDNSLTVNGNANATGLGKDGGVGVGGQSTDTSVVKAKPGQRTHGEYQNNTNSCASCHQTHTAASENLLFKDGVYTTCTACHDGTLGVLNVFTGSTAGTFAGTKDGNASMHLPTGAMETKSAPGGNHSTATPAGGAGTGWEAEFTCASCHSPHGSYSDRLLNYNPNGIGSTDMYFETTVGTYLNADGTASTDNIPVKTGGLKVVGATVVGTLPTANATSPEYVVYKTDSDSSTLIDSFTIKTGETAIDNKVTTESAGTKVIVLMKKVSKSSGTPAVTAYAYVRDMTPWINDSSTSARAKMTIFKNASGKSPVDAASKDLLTLKIGLAYVKNADPATTTALDTVVKADISRAVVVKFDFSATDEGSFNGLPVKQVDINSYAKTGYGVQIAQFCASCHTDYLAKSGSESGVWSKAFRHTTTSDTYTCLKCHFAHGTDVSVMLDSKDQSVASLTPSMGATAATAYLLDVNASSALKRYTNMSVCWKCHTSSHSGDMINNTFVSGVNSSVKSSTEFNTQGTNLPSGWVDPAAGTLPYGN